jgi:MinD-like ATPase involved in chromosome partitioning or flagellar assembly
VHCTDVEEASVLVSGSRRWSAVLVVGALDGSFVRAAHRAAVPVLAVASAGPGPEVPGVVAVSRSAPAVLDALHAWATPVPWARWHPSMPDPPSSGSVIAVCGPGGTGASTVAMALASGLAEPGADMVLADLALRAGQAVLHGIKHPMATVDDLVHAHRLGRLDPGQVRDFTVAVAGHPYRLLPGLRRPHQWTGVRPMAFDVTLAGLRSAFDLVVADVTGDFEGEHDTGSLDVEERNHMARHTVSLADIVVAVGSPGPTGRRSLDYTVEALSERGVDPDRLVTIINRTSVTDRPGAIALPHLRPNDGAADWGRPASRIVARLLDQLPPRVSGQPVLVPVIPGSIGHWDKTC